MKLIVVFTLALWLTGCAGFQKWFGENISDPVTALTQEPPLKYSETPQAGVLQDRQYKRMTRSRMEEESELQSNAGSLWVMEGQTSYMFAQNKMRREGDATNIKLEGMAMKQVETKANNIKTLLKEIEEEEKRRKAEENGTAQPLATKEGEKPQDGTREPAAAAAAPKPVAAEKPKEEKLDLSDVQSIPSKIVERMQDGNYRIKGSQPFIIEKKEYKVIVSGTIKPEDFSDEGISSAKLLDPQYDVVSIRRAAKDENSF